MTWKDRLAEHRNKIPMAILEEYGHLRNREDVNPEKHLPIVGGRLPLRALPRANGKSRDGTASFRTPISSRKESRRRKKYPNAPTAGEIPIGTEKGAQKRSPTTIIKNAPKNVFARNCDFSLDGSLK